MKKKIFVALLILFVTSGLLFAQNRRWDGAGFDARRYSVPEQVDISGTLTIVDGFIAVQSGEVTYYLMGINRYVGFIDGLKYGAAVQLEGYARQNGRNTSYMFVEKLTLDGRTFDLGSRLGGGGTVMRQPFCQPLQRQPQREPYGQPHRHHPAWPQRRR